MSKKNRIRLYVDTPLKEGVCYKATDNQAHYLKNVMRLNIGDEVFLFDGQNGEFFASVLEISKKELVLSVQRKVFDFEKSPDIWLLFAPLKKENTDFVIQKAVELGASKIVAVKTDYTNVSALKEERIKTQIVEAAEQCRRQDVPTFQNVTDFEKIIEAWPEGRKLIYLNETGDGQTFWAAAKKMLSPAALLIGPEGGFSKKELEILKKLPYSVNVSLPKRILRAETAALTALACWQAFCGDWK